MAKSTHTVFGPCKKAVVYKVPLTCGSCYIGQTNKCINERLTEHNRSKKEGVEEYKNLINHTKICGCKPDFEKTLIMQESGSSKLSREILEAFWIEEKGQLAVSSPSVKLIPREFQVLKEAGYHEKIKRVEREFEND